MVRCLGIVVAVVLMGSGALPAGARAQTVIELFTSQGCDSCPPADALLTRLDRRDDVFGLTLAVDYWDYLGWKDRFADPMNTRRQRDYQAFLGGANVYTPQMVIGGAAQAVGSDQSAVDAAIAHDQSRAIKQLPVSIEWQDKSMVIDLPPGQPLGAASVWLVLYDHERQVAVKAGENGGRLLVYRNVVREIRRIGTWDGRSGTIVVSEADFEDHPHTDHCAVLVQERGTGPIIGVARTAMK